MESATKPSAKQLAREAMNLGVDGAADMTYEELSAAVAAKKAPAKKAPAKKAPAKKAPATSSSRQVENPFRKGSSLYILHDLLVRGGTRERIATQLSKKVTIHPYSKSEITLSDYDRRVTLAAGTLKNKFGYTVETEGSGMSGKIRAIPPLKKG